MSNPDDTNSDPLGALASPQPIRLSSETVATPSQAVQEVSTSPAITTWSSTTTPFPIPIPPSREPTPIIPDSFEAITPETPFRAPSPPPPLRIRAAPHRQKNFKTPKGILKPATVAPARFSFKRDILQPFNSRLAYAAGTSTLAPLSQPATSANNSGPTASLNSVGNNSSSGGTAGNQGGGGGVAAALQHPTETLKNVVNGTSASTVVGNAAAAAGGFWGSALKKLSAVGVNQPQPNPPPAPRETTKQLNENTPTTQTLMPTASPTNADSQPLNFSHNLHERVQSLDGPAPHTPTRSTPTSSTISSSPYATVKVSAASTLPAAPVPPPLSVRELRRVRFRMGALKIVYPINGPNGPLAPYEESVTRKRINQEQRNLNLIAQESGESKGWTGESLGELYFRCCQSREEIGIPKLRRLFKDSPRAPPKVIDLSNEILTHGAVEALSDLLSIDFGLKKLVLENCGLDDESLRPLLHALLVSGNIGTLSFANNKKIRAKGWKFLAIFLRKAKFLKYLDLSEISIDKRTADLLVQALTPSLCGVMDTQDNDEKSTAMEQMSELKEISTQPNQADSQQTSGEPESNASESEEAEEEESEEEEEEEENFSIFSQAPLLKEDAGQSNAACLTSLRLENCGLKGQALEALAHGIRSSQIKHISIRKNKISPLGANSLAIMIRDYPIHSETGALENSLQNAEMNEFSLGSKPSLNPPSIRRTAGGSPRSTSPELGAAAQQVEKDRQAWTNSEARVRLRKQIQDLPRTGNLLTLDVKGNDIRHGTQQIAQVLKRNRTLKVLNLSDNKIDVNGLIQIAEALKFNSTLETLDLSFNPCCGPSLEGISALRSAITLSSNLKRIFLNGTELNSQGAIALSEFLPEATSLIHLDLTSNFDIDIAGVLVLSVSVKMNSTLRCLDLNIPPNDPEFARLSQEILQCCIRNTEQAQTEAVELGKKTPISAPIHKSTIQRNLVEAAELSAKRHRLRVQQTQNKDEILLAAEGIVELLTDLLNLETEAKLKGILVKPGEVMKDTLTQAQLAEAQLNEAVVATRGATPKDRIVLDALSNLLDRAKILYETPSAAPSTPAGKGQQAHVTHLTPTSPVVMSEDPSSPAFSIADSSEDEETENSAAVSDSGANQSPLKRFTPAKPLDPVSVTMSDSPSQDTTNNADTAELKSPIESQSRNQLLEEGEIFRKGAQLGTGQINESDDEDDGTGLSDVTGEELRKEILDLKLEKSPRNSFSETSGMEGIESSSPVSAVHDLKERLRAKNQTEEAHEDALEV